MTMTVPGHLDAIRDLWCVSVRENREQIAQAVADEDGPAMRSAYDSAAFLEIVAAWIRDAEDGG